MKFFLLLLSSFYFFCQANAAPLDLKIKQLNDNIYQHISYKDVKPFGLVGASGLVFIDGRSAYIIDSPWTLEATKQLIDWVEIKGLKLKGVIATHFHEDASGDIAYFNQLGISTFASRLTNQLLGNEQKALATTEITTNSFSLAGGKLEFFYPGPGHTKDNIVVWLPNEKTLFGGCFVKSKYSKHLGYTGDADINAWPLSIDKLLKRYPNIKTVVPGHGKIGDTSILLHTKNLTISHAIADK